MKAMVLAAGRGERLRPYTDECPKPLLTVGQHRLIEYHMFALAEQGVDVCVVNHAWLGEQVPATLGDGSNYGLKLLYSDEGDTKLETGGGVFRALPMLGEQPFLLINGDVQTDFPLSRLRERIQSWPDQRLAHLVLVPNPPQHPGGDFAINEEGLLKLHGTQKQTYAGIAVLHPDLFAGCEPGVFSIVPLLKSAAEQGRVSAELYQGHWSDVGTPERLQQAREYQRAKEARA